MAGEESHDGAAEGSRCRHRRRRFGRDNNPGSQSDDRGDLISALPDEILQRILSFIPTKYAIGTTILSKRWRYIWSQTPLLNLDGYGLSASSIDKTLASYAAAKIRNFHLRLDVRDQDMASHVDRWIQIATSRHVEELSLDIRLLPEVKYDLPDFLYINSTISRLSLWLRFFDMAPSGAVSWTSLRSLSLSYCILTDESIARVLSGCPMLERLTLCSCEGIQCLDLSESVRLRSLDVVGIIDTSLAPREIVAPHIHTLWLAGSIPCCWLVDVSSLTEAEVEICFCQEDIGSYLIDGLLAMVLEMLKQLQNAEKLTFGMTFLQILSLAELLGFPFPTLKNKVFTFETMITKSVLPGIARLLKNSPNLKELTALTGSCICIPDEYLDDYLYDEDLNLDECCRSRHGIFPHLLDTLEALENKATKPKLAASFMEFLLQNTWALEKMIFRPAQNVVTSEFEELLEMARTLSSPRSGDSSGPSIFLKRLKSNVLFSV